MGKTTIAWTDESSNPIRAIRREHPKIGWFCTKIDTGCQRCYAERINLGRFGNGLEYVAQNEGIADFILQRTILDRWKKTRKPHKEFICDMTDLFHRGIPDVMILEIFEAMAFSKNITFQVLTKRIARAENLMVYDPTDESSNIVHRLRMMMPLSNLWIGASVCDQRGLWRIDSLRRIPAAVRFLSLEPLLENLGSLNLKNINWVIVGGESGPAFRTMDLDWARSIRDQCVAAGVPFWFKQESGLRSGANPTLDGVTWHQFPKDK